MMSAERKRKWRKKKAKDPAFRKRHADWMREWRKKNPESYKASADRYYTTHPERVKASQFIYRQRVRKQVLQHYGNQCVCCGETQSEFLAIDHINGGGNAHRKQIGGSSLNLMLWLIKHNYPKNFQVLCHNCNMAKAIYGVCPHVSSSSKSFPNFS